jgi:hypothetical protein
MKTSKRAQWKPSGNNGIPDTEITLCAIMLAGENITEDQIKNWSQEQRDEAYDWAMRIHFKASDNSYVRVPSRPEFL